MARVVGDISVRVGADVGPLQQGMNRGTRSMRDFERSSAQMAANVAKAGAVVVTAMAGIATGVLAAAKEASSAANEIKNLANVAGTGTTEFQKMAAAAKTVGIEQDKLSDIFKDVNDKFGDFMATGAGPLADFFENIAPKVGVTADQFAKLSGPDALQLYVTSLENANVSQQEMTFYMEAIASDATGLVPLLADAGSEMRRLGNAAEDAGRILDEDMIESAAELDRKLDELSDTLRTSVSRAVLENAEEIEAFAEVVSNVIIPALANLVGALSDVVGAMAEVGASAIENGKALLDFLNTADTVSGSISRGDMRRGTAPAVPDAPEVTQIDPGGPLGVRGRNGAVRGQVAAEINPGEAGEGGREGPYYTPPTPESGPEYGGRGLAAGPTPEEALETAVALRAERLEAERAANEEIEDEEERHAGRVKEIKEESLEELAALEEAAQRARLQSVSGALGDLSSLMRTENEKLFKVGQAAAIAQATVSGYQSAVDAWQKGMAIGGPPVAAAFSAASLVKTGVLISQIRSAGSSGGGGGGGSGGGISSAVGGSGGGSSPLQVQLSGISPDELVSGANVTALLERLSEEAGDRGFTLLES